MLGCVLCYRACHGIVVFIKILLTSEFGRGLYCEMEQVSSPDWFYNDASLKTLR